MKTTPALRTTLVTALLCATTTALLAPADAQARPGLRGFAHPSIASHGGFGGGGGFSPHPGFRPGPEPGPHPGPGPGPGPGPHPGPGPGPHPGPGPGPGPGPHPGPGPGPGPGPHPPGPPPGPGPHPYPPPPPPPYWDHPFWDAAAVTAGVALTAAAIGSVVYTLPVDCSTIVVNGIGYQQCSDGWYQPRYVGTTVQYVVVDAPR